MESLSPMEFKITLMKNKLLSDFYEKVRIQKSDELTVSVKELTPTKNI